YYLSSAHLELCWPLIGCRHFDLHNDNIGTYHRKKYWFRKYPASRSAHRLQKRNMLCKLLHNWDQWGRQENSLEVSGNMMDLDLEHCHNPNGCCSISQTDSPRLYSIQFYR